MNRLIAPVLSVLTIVAAAAPAEAAFITLTGSLNASQVVDANNQPASTSTATGLATVTVDTVAQTITTDLSWDGLSGNADRAHLHDAPAGVSRLQPPNDRFFHEVINEIFDAQGNDTGMSTVDGGFVTCGGTPTVDWDPGSPCAPATGSLHDFLQLDASRFDPNGVFGFTDFNALLAAFETGGLFLDMHTESYPGGEIRGQLLFNGVPEPTTLALLGVALLGLLPSRKRAVSLT